MARLHRYWIRFMVDAVPDYNILKLGCGVTAWTEDDAIWLIRKYVFAGEDVPAIDSIVTDIDIRDLEAGHVRPNVGVVSRRGVWFPLGGDLAPHDGMAK